MKKILVLVLLAIPLAVQGQFLLTKDGFVNLENNSISYVVYDIDGKNKEALYMGVLKFITSNYVSAKDVISKVDNEVITISALQPKAITCKMVKYDVSYTIVISFKDNKIKIDAPIFECTSYGHDKPFRITMSGSNGGLGSVVTVGLFKKNGEKAQGKTILQLEDFFNNLSEKIKSSASGTGENNDW
jgi:hypothetical protein